MDRNDLSTMNPFAILAAALAAVMLLLGAAPVRAQSPDLLEVETKLLAWDAEWLSTARDQFGHAVDVSDDLLVVGATKANKVFSFPNQGSGAAYLFRWDGTTWQPIEKLLSFDPEDGEQFGSAVAVSGDVIVVGSPGRGSDNRGAVWVFRLDAQGVPQYEAMLTGADTGPSDGFGAAVDVAGDHIVVGVPLDDDGGTSAGAAYVFHYDGSGWVQEAKHANLPDPVEPTCACYQGFGGSVAIEAVDLDTWRVAAGTRPSQDEWAHVRVFRHDHYSSTPWTEEAWIFPPNAYGSNFGTSLALTGDLLAVGDNDVDRLRTLLYRFDGSSWVPEATLVDPDGGFGFGGAVAALGDQVLVGSMYQAHLFEFDGSAWVLAKTLQSPDGETSFGAALALAPRSVLVGDWGNDEAGLRAGAAYFYRTTQCSDGVDQDGNGLVDLDDASCADANDDAEWRLSSRDIVVADMTGALVRVDPATGEQTVLVSRPDLGEGPAGVVVFGVAWEPAGPAIGSGSNLVFTQNTGALLRLDIETGGLTTISRGDLLDRTFGGIYGVRRDGDGTFLVGASGSDRTVVRVDPVNGFQTIAAGPTGALVALDLVAEPDGKLLVSDHLGSRILRFDPADPDGEEVLVSTAQPGGLELDTNGDLLLVDYFGLHRLDRGTGDVLETVWNADAAAPPLMLALEADGGIVVSANSPARVLRIDPATGSEQELTVGGPLQEAAGVLVIPTQCANGLDDDGDGFVDANDPHCTRPGDDREAAGRSRCGLGFEQMLLLPALLALRRRRSRR